MKGEKQPVFGVTKAHQKDTEQWTLGQVKWPHGVFDRQPPCLCFPLRNREVTDIGQRYKHWPCRFNDLNRFAVGQAKGRPPSFMATYNLGKSTAQGADIQASLPMDR